MPTDPRLIDFLLNPENYPEKPSVIEHFETHISHVFVGDDFAYKIKKPVDFGFLDFTTLKRRHWFCAQEVSVNSALAGDVYLGVEPIFGREGEYSFRPNKGWKTIEYAVRMKRIPAKALLSTLVTDGRLLYGRMQSVGTRLSAFHREGPAYRGQILGGLKSVLTNTEENFEQIRPFVGAIIQDDLYSRLKDYTGHFIEENSRLFENRRQAGFVRDGHGDLHAQHICLTDPPIILDRIEFSRRFRIGDVLEDIAFLFMDLEFHGRFDLSATLFTSYFEGERERCHEGLLKFYKIYRAIVRAKIQGFASLNLREEDARLSAARMAEEYYLLAQHYLDHEKSRFNPVVFMGVSGSGKSAISRDLLRGSVYLRSDEIRKQVAGISMNEHVYADYQAGIYDKQTTEKVYKEVTEKAVEIAEAGRLVAVDATFGSSAYRAGLLSASIKAGLNPFFVHCFARPAVLAARVARRMANGHDISDAHGAVVDEQIKREEQPEELPFFRVMHLDTEDRLDHIRASLRLFLG